MKHPAPCLLTVVMLLTAMACRKSASGEESTGPVHEEMNSVYYWKTRLQLDSAEKAFLRRYLVDRVYLRMFDVTADAHSDYPDEAAVPNASVKVDYQQYNELRDSMSAMEFVPVVYVTVEALKAMKGREGQLAERIVTRVSNMAVYNGLPNVAELQLDCDWTPSTEQSFFALCDSVKSSFASRGLPWRLSSTIRLHQLSRKVPPVDLGVLMVYNTGSFDNPDAANSIIDLNDIKPYLGKLPSYPLHLDVAYPAYSWQLLFRNRKFLGICKGLDLADTIRWSPKKNNSFEALTDYPHNEILIRKGDIVRAETSKFTDIQPVKELIENKLSGKPHSNIIYHLDIENLSNYSTYELQNIFHSGR